MRKKHHNLNRRSFFEAGSLLMGGLTLPDLLRSRAAGKQLGVIPKDTSVILIWLQGGPSHMDTYDLKPDAPREYRGEVSPISTVVPGLDVCELLPRHAEVADRFNLIRSISHGFANHAGGAGRFLSGYNPSKPLDPLAQSPCIGPVVSKMLQGSKDPRMPVYIPSAKNVYGGGAANLGSAYLPFVVSGDPDAANFKVNNLSLAANLRDRIDDRTSLLKAVDNLKRRLDSNSTMDSLDKFNQQAISLLTGDKAVAAFDISQEDDKTRACYGRHKWGQRALLARRLVEAGCSFVTMQMQNPRVPNGIGNWDIHAVNGHLYDDAHARFGVANRLGEPGRGRYADVHVLVFCTAHLRCSLGAPFASSEERWLL